ncbi:MAG: chemotaxis protein CheY [Peptococcaceae bacterium BICA1-8]|nr:MAG: chemotaxis protein CheY [Peptococcaceae bacterium BICA1-8]KJS87289.1 MAG: chemotaxis protein CheY [Peptococcaceae bacterium BICA1-8]
MARILICDDSLFMRYVLRKILENGGHEVIGEAENGLEAIEKYKEFMPELATMDITMPEMDGIRALENIKREIPEAKIIMVSAMGQESMVKEAIHYGASDFIIKPLKEGRVLHAIEKVLGNNPLGNILY